MQEPRHQQNKPHPEIRGHIPLIQYEKWHPRVDENFWQRLEVSGQPRNGTYKNPAEFDRKEFWNADASTHVSHHDRLLHWDSQLGSAFVVEHFLRENGLGLPNPKILEIGTWPMKNPIVATQFDNTSIALLSQNIDFRVVGVDKVNIETAFPYKSYTPPNFGDGKFINGDFHDAQIQEAILHELGGQPNLILGNMVFEKRLGNFDIRQNAQGEGPIIS